MAINYVMAIDPGKATGIAIGRYSDMMPMEIVFTGIVSDGVRGVALWLHHTRDGKTIMENDCSYNYPEDYDDLDYHLDVVCENFNLRGGNFTPDLEPVRIEGVLIDHFGSIVTWQSPADKKMVGDDFLKSHGFWVTGADVDHEDGRDANDAMLHLFAHAMRTRHMPTLRTYFKG
jgi:hypothetical protein